MPPVAEPPLGAFRAEARAVIESYLADAASHGGAAERSLAVFHETSGEKEAAEVAAARDWQRSKARHGLAWVTGPVEFGGRSLHDRYERALRQLESEYPVPDTSPLRIGIGTVAPAILGHGTTGQQEEYLRPIHAGDVIACQLFSEPEAGSDLAALRTTARRGDDGTWRVTGQKVWTSNAQFADIGMLIARTGEQAGRHRTLTVFLVDMRAPGIDVRPLRQMTGGASFNEVFFTEVRVPDDHRLGDVNQGWAVALTTLMNERSSIGAGGAGNGLGVADVSRLSQMLRHVGLGESAVHRDELMDLYVRFQVAKYTNQRALDRIKSGQLPGPEMSIAKMALTDNLTRVGAFVAGVLGPRMQANTGEWGTYAWSKFLCGTPGMRIAGGSDEVLRNIVGERVLGLPKEPGIDSNSPFRDTLKN